MSQASAIGSRLSVMMFLQFFIWGSWYVTVGNYIGSVGWQQAQTDDAIGWAYTVGPIAAIIAPLFLGVVADRFFATQRVLGTLHLFGAAAMFTIPYVANGPDGSPYLLVTLLFLHMLCYMPTLGLTNTLAFHHLTNQEKQFPIIRVFGTLGWIAANWLVSGQLGVDADAVAGEAPIALDTRALQFWVCGAACTALGLFSFTLPHTPPPLAGRKVSVGQIFGFDAIGLLKDPSFLVFMLSSFLVCIPLAAYYQQAPIFTDAMGFAEPGKTMSYGQIAEVVFMLLMPAFFARLGVKKMIAIGMLAWVVRYGLFAAAADDSVKWMVLAGILLHGICYDFFFVTGQIYVDKFAPTELRGQAQGFLVLITQGLGLGIGAKIVQATVTSTTAAEGARDWGTFWLYPAIMAGAILIVFVLAFREKRSG